MNTPKVDSKLITHESNPSEQPGEIPKWEWPIGPLQAASQADQVDQSQEGTA